MKNEKAEYRPQRSVIIFAPCLLNPSLVACGYYNSISFEMRKRFMLSCIDLCFDNHVSVDTYACPEYAVLGVPRPPSSRSFYEKSKETLLKIAKELVKKIKRYEKEGIRVLAIVGVDGSPTCGVTRTKEGVVWDDNYLRSLVKKCAVDESFGDKLRSKLYSVQGKGIFMEILERTLEAEKINIPVLGFSEKDPEALLKELEEIIHQSLCKSEKDNV